MLILLALLQVTPTTSVSSVAPDRFSILAEPCGRGSGSTPGDDVVVCGGKADLQRLPLPFDRMPSGPAPSNPHLRPDAALAVESTPCAASQRGCQVGIGGPIVAAAVSGLATAISDGLADAKVRKARRHDAGKRVPIPLD